MTKTVDKWPPEDKDTDPELFKQGEAITVRRCMNCKQEIPVDDGSFRRGAVHVLETLRAYLERRDVTPDGAANFAIAVAQEAGVTLI